MTDTGYWQGKTVLVTGGGGGMGQAIAQRFAAAGAKLVVADLAVERAEAVATEVGNGAIAVGANVARVIDCERMVGAAIEATGRLDLLVNGAGVWVEGDADTMMEEDWDRVIDVNLKGTFFSCRYAIPELEKTGGQIVNISSDAGLVGNNGAAIYCASKGGVSILTKALAIELAPRGIRVNAICPCDVETPMIEFQAKTYGQGDPEAYRQNLLSKYPQRDRARFAKPQEIAAFIFALTSPDLAPVTGANLSIDFGLTAGY